MSAIPAADIPVLSRPEIQSALGLTRSQSSLRVIE
jgi:hypothetical protein